MLFHPYLYWCLSSTSSAQAIIAGLRDRLALSEKLSKEHADAWAAEKIAHADAMQVRGVALQLSHS